MVFGVNFTLSLPKSRTPPILTLRLPTPKVNAPFEPELIFRNGLPPCFITPVQASVNSHGVPLPKDAVVLVNLNLIVEAVPK